MHFGKLFGTAAVAAVVATTAVAQQPQTVRVRGEITKVEGNVVSIKARNGDDLTVKLAEPLRIAAMVKSSMDDIKEGSFIGVSAFPQPDGTYTAPNISVGRDIDPPQ